MKKIAQIARLELSLLFYSPIAWLVMIALFVQLSMVFVPSAMGAELFQEWIAAHPRFHVSNWTINMLMDPTTGTFGRVLPFLYIYTPLITMGLVSRETSSGTINLLYSSPLNIRQIVFGKYAAMMAFNAVIMGLLCLVVICAGLSIVRFDTPHALVGLLGIYLMLCAYSAIGLFMSSLTTYQVVAAIMTFVVLAFLSYVGGFFQGTDVLRDICYSLWIPQRPIKMLVGLLTTRDVIYFLSIIYMFLAFTVSKLWMARNSKRISYRIGRYLAIGISGIAITYLTSRPGFIGYYDATETKANTISKNSQDILKKMDAPIEITEYVNFLGDGYNNAAPEKRNEDVDRWEPFIRWKPDIHMKWVYYYDSLPAGSPLYKYNPGKSTQQIFDESLKFSGYGRSLFRTPQEIHKMIDLQDEGARVVMQLKYKGRKTWLRTFNDTYFWPSEAEISAALKRMIVPLPKVVFSNDGYERSIDKLGDRDYKTLTNLKTFRYSLINQGFDMDTMSLKKDEIPAGIAALVIADRKTGFDTAALEKIRRYVDRGGNLLIAGEPGKQSVDNTLLSYLGVQLMNGTIVQRSKDFSYDLTTPYLTSDAAPLALTLKYSLDDSIPVAMPGLAGLSYAHTGPFTIKPLLMTDLVNAWNKMGNFILDSAALEYVTANGDQKGSFPSALAMTRMIDGREQRILVSGDADFLSNLELSRANPANCNFNFGNAIFGWFAYNEFPIQTTHPRGTDDTIRLTTKTVMLIKVLFYGVIPGIFLLLGTVILIRRKRK